MKRGTDAISLTKQLVSLPSYVAGEADESAVVDFLEQFFTAYLPELSVSRQYFDGSRRANLVITGKRPPKLLVLGHIDTVQPKDGWLTDPCKPIIRNGSLFGLGAADMKGSLAAFLSALVSQKAVDRSSIMILLYGDEEYDFKGMRRCLEDTSVVGSQPEMMLSLDGSMRVASGCRGLIEISARLRGASGHAANPANGCNAIIKTVEAVKAVEQALQRYSDNDLGPSTLNLASLRGGTTQNVKGKTEWQQAANIIPDVAEVILEVRPATSNLSAQVVRKLFDTSAVDCGLALEACDVRHDIAPWMPAYDSPQLTRIQNVYRAADVPFAVADGTLSGYIDAQMLVEKIPVPTFIIGVGGQNRHSANESATITEIIQVTSVYKTLLQEFL